MTIRNEIFQQCYKAPVFYRELKEKIPHTHTRHLQILLDTGKIGKFTAPGRSVYFTADNFSEAYEKYMSSFPPRWKGGLKSRKRLLQETCLILPDTE